MTTRLIILLLSVATFLSCQAIARRQLGIKDPKVEKQKTLDAFIEKNKIANGRFLKKEKIFDSYIGEFPKIYIFNKQGHQVLLPNCFQMIKENLYALVDTIPDKLSADSFRDKFVAETIEWNNNPVPGNQTYDYEIYFYWSIWLGKYNVQKLRTAQETIDAINKSQGQQKLVLTPLNFDFIEESGWTEQSMDAEIHRIAEFQKGKQ